jgi:hypothetical protein
VCVVYFAYCCFGALDAVIRAAEQERGGNLRTQMTMSRRYIEIERLMVIEGMLKVAVKVENN